MMQHHALAVDARPSLTDLVQAERKKLEIVSDDPAVIYTEL